MKPRGLYELLLTRALSEHAALASPLLQREPKHTTAFPFRHAADSAYLTESWQAVLHVRAAATRVSLDIHSGTRLASMPMLRCAVWRP